MKCTISGSFRKFHAEILRAYDVFDNNGISVLAPRKSEAKNPGAELILLETDPSGATVKQIEDAHLAAIAASNFLYVVNPGGYIGPSVTLEMGYAHGLKKPIFSSDLPSDHALKAYITEVRSTQDMCDYCKDFTKHRML